MLLAALAVAIAGCGPAAAQRAPEPAPISVAAAEAPDEDVEEPGIVEETERRGAALGTLSACIDQLRTAPGFSSPPQQSDDYAEALAFERQGDLKSARLAYFKIIQHAPQSPYVPLVYLAFAELFYGEALTDPSKWELAKQAYREVSKYPPPGNPAYAYSLLRLAQIEQTQGAFSHALLGFVKVAEAVRTRSDAVCGAELELSARDGAVRTFAQAGAPDKAWSLFRRHGGDQAELWLAELGDEYLRLGKAADACTALRSAGSAAGAVLEQARRRACP
jgi:tetratricopeptide (TPR) repeat protein